MFVSVRLKHVLCEEPSKACAASLGLSPCSVRVRPWTALRIAQRGGGTPVVCAPARLHRMGAPRGRRPELARLAPAALRKSRAPERGTGLRAWATGPEGDERRRPARETGMVRRAGYGLAVGAGGNRQDARRPVMINFGPCGPAVGEGSWAAEVSWVKRGTATLGVCFVFVIFVFLNHIRRMHYIHKMFDKNNRYSAEYS